MKKSICEWKNSIEPEKTQIELLKNFKIEQNYAYKKKEKEKENVNKSHRKQNSDGLE